MSDNPLGVLFKPWLDSQKDLLRSLADQKAPRANMPGVENWAESLAEQGKEMNNVIQKSMEAWTSLAQQGKGMANGAVDMAALQQIIDPAAWSKAGTGWFDRALMRLTDGPAYATLWNLEGKLEHARNLWTERAQDVASYQSLIQAAWGRAFKRFTEEINDAKRPPINSGKALLDIWINIANETLLEAHRTDEFLQAQARMTRSSSNYRLHEREMAEAYCEMHHIPTRTEVDEVQRIVCELRREIRSLKRQVEDSHSKPAPAKRAQAKKKAAPVKAAPRRKGVK